MNEMTPNQMRERLGNIDQIRDILFGDRSREYDRRFNQLESELTTLRRQMTEQMESLRTVFVTDLRTAIDAVEKKLQYVNASLDEDSEDLRNQLRTVESRLSSNFVVAEKSLKSQVRTLEEDLTETRTRLDGELAGLRSQILEELQRKSQQLEGEKLSRTDLADILFDVCMQVKGKETQAQETQNANPERLILPERQNEYQDPDYQEPDYHEDPIPDSQSH
ncbi:hypothetical protein E1H12_02475 [Geitlerinema sp. P-1104]|uniref:hypothetical protein n=1 Tax=Geitlerinema sp. P-1104 TaxID=2546230 RepID=UPI0014770464|nr:hypothetical protein [Geitlerinema sp. P-1104]NMG57412.1 hypothetical protein [Geitlerinema sp. P-1104]